MKNVLAKVLSSSIVNKGPIGKVKDYFYYKVVSNKVEAQTDIYRKEILRDFYEIFNECKWMVASGSFLRYYRDHTMQGQDLDILIDFDDFKKAKNQLSQRGYYLLAEFSDEFGNIREYKLKYKKAEIDIIFVFHDEDGWYYVGTYEDPLNKKNVIREVNDGKRIVHGTGYCAYRKWIPDFETAEYEFDGMKFRSYKNVNEHLTAEYGNWKIPDPNFDFLASPANNMPKKISCARVIYYLNPKKAY